jgi:hypothetical protein
MDKAHRSAGTTREKNQCGIVEESDSQIEIAITANRRVEQKDECSETKRGEVKNETGARPPCLNSTKKPTNR